MNYILIVLYTIALLFFIQKWKLFAFEGINRKWFQVVLLLKISAGLGLYWIYTEYYTVRANADIFKYFDDSTTLYNSFWTKPGDFFQMMLGIDCEGDHFRTTYYDNMFTWFKSFDSQIFNNNRTMIRLNAAIRFISNGSYHIHALIMSFLSMVGIALIMKTFKRTVEKFKGVSVILIFLLPSTLIWTSGILKGALLILWVGLLLYSFSRLKNSARSTKVRIIYGLLIPIMLFFIFTTKYYILIAGAPIGIAALLSFIWKGKSLLRYGIGIGICLILFLITSKMESDFNPSGLIMSKHNNMVQHDLAQHAGSAFDIGSYQLEDPQSNAWSLIKSSPNAFYNTFFQPTPSNISNPMALLAFFENIFILLFLIVCCIFIRKPTNWPMVLGISIFVIVLYVILGWTTSNAGAIVRYKVPALPFIIILGLELINREKFFSVFKFLKKSNPS
ncbi:MAG: hypothetical protein JKY54_17465 [Flavobacteriales bacterium]|nr:hypothetical protein [Flavobacteriales bacterium]